MDRYETGVKKELEAWKLKMKKSPSLVNRFSKRMQTRINRMIPEKVHEILTTAIKQMIRVMQTGSGITNPPLLPIGSLEQRERMARAKIKNYRNTATAEGAITGAGGILLGLADFPIWLTVKMKMVFEIAAVYGHDVKDYKERLFMLEVFQLTFSGDEHRIKTFTTLTHWEEHKHQLPSNMNDFNWRDFQQEYREYLDLAKLLQLVPGIGAVVGAFVNHRLTQKLGDNAMMCYRMRWFSSPSRHNALLNAE
jgi:uncharacterized protein (DUF697 family)